ncbi:hypothetical protein COCON_G00105750 [Conger conger]|uniref:Ig-like domain-containing protein n=1 Tax=Conger conger TaxID=82655 RepID=A0A9Q1DIT8_CONCO|nr:hypothetical protein COCON_G00105750 [Conger conger]
MPLPCIISLFVFSLMMESLETVLQKAVDLGDAVELRCIISYHYEITWMRQGPNEVPTILLVAKLEDAGKVGYVYQRSKHFIGVSSNRSISLMIKGITKADYALYYCAGKDTKILNFGNGTQLLDPGSGMQVTHPVTKDYVGSEKAPDDHSGWASPLFYQLYAALQGLGLLGMISALAAVHLKSRKQRV